MAQFTEFQRRKFEWYDIVRLSGDDGCRWMDEYRRHQQVNGRIADSLTVVRKGDVRTGGEMLATAWDELSRAEIGDAATRSVLERWYYGALGYYFYAQASYDEADEAMTRAETVVAGALGRWDFLMFLADEAVDIRMHRARIARNRQQWRLAREHIEVARAMRLGRQPYYVLPNGFTVEAAQIRDFLNALPVPGGELVAPHLQSEAAALRSLELFEREIYRIPGFVIAQS